MFYTSYLLAEHNVKAVFTDKLGGCSEAPFDSLNLGFDLGDLRLNVEKNLNLFCVEAGFPMPHQAKQAHGSQVLVCDGEGGTHDDEADILVTTLPNVALAVRTADCVPILLADQRNQVIAAVHAGWKGTVAQVAQKAVVTMCEFGALPKQIVASIGPSICGDCFEVNQSIVNQLNASCNEDVSKHDGDRIYANLLRTNMLQLQNVGLQQCHIEASKACTVCASKPPYFSYRRDQGETGRQLATIMMG